jgi:hypothetical protein
MYAYVCAQTGKLPGAVSKKALLDTGLDKKTLRTLWPLADLDKDGACFYYHSMHTPFHLTSEDTTRRTRPLPLRAATR